MRKLIDLPEEVSKALAKEAVDLGMSFKKNLETILIDYAKKNLL